MTVILPGGVGQLFAVPGFSAFNPANAGTYATFSNNNRTLGGSSAIYPGTSTGTKGRSTGKYYFEVLCTGAVATQSSAGLVVSPWTPVNDVIGGNLDNSTNGPNDYSVNYSSGYGWYVWNQGTNYQPGPITPGGTGDVIKVAVDFTNSPTYIQVYFGVNTMWSNAGSISTIFGTSPDVSYTIGSITLLPAASSSHSNTMILNVGNAAFAYAPPSGFVAWG